MGDTSAIYAGAGMIVAGVGLIAFMARRQKLGEESKGWPTASGRIISSEVKSYSSSEGGRKHSPAIAYVYTVEGREYRSDRIAFDEIVAAGWARQMVNKYPAGAEVLVRYDPRDPSRAVLEAVSAGACFYGVVGCSFVLVGLFFVIWFGFVRK